jgi:hypothetical protein
MRLICCLLFSGVIFCAATEKLLPLTKASLNCSLFVDLQIVGDGPVEKIQESVFADADDFCPLPLGQSREVADILRIEGVISRQEFQPGKLTVFGEMGLRKSSRRNFIAGDFLFSGGGMVEEEFISLEVWGVPEYRSFNELLTDFVQDLRKEIRNKK